MTRPRWFSLILCLLVARFAWPASGHARPANPGPQAAQTSRSPSVLTDLLRSPNADTRARAARDIGKSGDVADVPALAAGLNDPSVKVRREIVLALAALRAPQSLQALITAAQDPDSDLRVLALQALVGYYTGQHPTTGLGGFVKKSYQAVKGHFQVDTTEVDPGTVVDPKVVEALLAAMNDTRSIDPARQAAKGLGILLARAAVPGLVRAAHSVDEDLAREALQALSKIKDSAAGPQLVDLLNSSDKAVKQDAAVTVGILRAQTALAGLQSIYQNDPDHKTQLAALQGLAYMGDPASAPLLARALGSSESQVRALGAEGLARAADPKSMPELQKAAGVETDDGARLALQFALASLGSDSSLAELVHSLNSRLRGDVARSYLIELARQKQYLAKLYPYLNDPDSTVRRKLCEVLMYSGDASSLEPLEGLTHDRNSDVAAAALRALGILRARTAGQP